MLDVTWQYWFRKTFTKHGRIVKFIWAPPPYLRIWMAASQPTPPPPLTPYLLSERLDPPLHSSRELSFCRKTEGLTFTAQKRVYFWRYFTLHYIILVGSMSAHPLESESVMLDVTWRYLAQHRWRRARGLEKGFTKHARIIKFISLAPLTLKRLTN